MPVAAPIAVTHHRLLQDHNRRCTNWISLLRACASKDKKTHYMCFSAKTQSKAWYIIKIDGEIIAEVTSSKFLGVIIDDKLNWKDHVSFVCRKVARGLGVIIKARKVLRNESLKNLYYSFIYPYLIYCNQVWGSACKTNIEPLFILQKRP